MAKKQSGRLGTIGSAVVTLILGVLVTCAVLLVVLGFLARPGKDGVSRLGGHPILTVLSGSMVPTFHPGDMVVDNRLTGDQASRLVKGDIITFHEANTSGGLITHRIVAVKHVKALGAPNGVVRYQTKGDANNVADRTPVSPDQIVGVYSRHLPYGGYFLQAVQKKVVFFLLILLPLLYLIGSEIAKRWNEQEAPADTEERPESLPSSPEHGVLVPAADAGPLERGFGSY